MLKAFFKNQALRSLSALAGLAVVAAALAVPLNVAFADAGSCIVGTTGCDYLPLTTLPGAYTACDATTTNGTLDTSKCTAVNPMKVVTNLYGVAIGIAALLAVGMITWAGIEYATTEAITGKSDAKEHWQGAIIGLLVLLGSYVVLRTINIDLVNVDLGLGDPTKGTGVSGDVLQGVVNQANSDAQAATAVNQSLQQSQANVATLQSQKTALQKQMNDFYEENAVDGVLDSTDAAKYADLQKQADALDTNIAAAQTDLATKQTAAINATAQSNISNANAAVQVNVAKGDYATVQQGIATAQTAITQQLSTAGITAAQTAALQQDRDYLDFVSASASTAQSNSDINSAQAYTNAQAAVSTIQANATKQETDLTNAGRTDLATQLQQQTQAIVSQMQKTMASSNFTATYHH